MPQSLVRRVQLDRLSVQLEPARGSLARIDQRQHRLRSAGADQPRHAEDLALSKIEIDVLDRAEQRKVPAGEDDVPDAGAALRIEAAQRPADHQRDDLVRTRFRSRPRPDVAAIAQDRDAVRNLEELVELVRDEDDRQP